MLRFLRLLIDEGNEPLLDSPLGVHSEIAVNVRGGRDVLVPEKRLHVLQFETRFLAPCAYSVSEAVPTDFGKASGQRDRLDMFLEELCRPERTEALRVR